MIFHILKKLKRYPKIFNKFDRDLKKKYLFDAKFSLEKDLKEALRTFHI